MSDAPEATADLSDYLQSGPARPRGRFYTGSLAKPNRNDYGVILAVNLIIGAYLFGLLASAAILSLAWASQLPRLEEITLELLSIAFSVALLSLFIWPAMLAGAVGFTCLFFIPLFESLVAWLGPEAAGRRHGMTLGAAVAGVVATPCWVLAGEPARQANLVLLTVLLVMMLQAAGALAAPGDVLAAGRRDATFRFSLRGLFVATTAIAVIVSLAAVDVPLLTAAVRSMAMTGATHLLTRRMTLRLLRWFLLRRLRRRRHVRLKQGYRLSTTVCRST